MKLALKHPKTLELLKQCDCAPWIMAGFFFHDRGSTIQKSVDGLLCEILYQILYQRMDLMELVFPIYLKEVQQGTRANTSDAGTTGSVWCGQALRDALRHITAQTKFKVNMCLFIDALDEHVGNHRELLRLLDDLVNLPFRSHVRVKLCLASRPENIFVQEFQDCPGFLIHRFTSRDIQHYTLSKMRLHSSPGSLTSLQELVEEVVEKALGVFIWVKLVVNELIEGLCDGDTIEALRGTLASIPSELEGLYQRAILRIGAQRASDARKRYSYETYVMFQIAICQMRPMSLQTFFAATINLVSSPEELANFQKSQQLPSTELLRRRLASRSGGLLEETETLQTGQGRIEFIHQTAKEFAQKDITSSLLLHDHGETARENGHVLIVRSMTQGICQGLPVGSWLLGCFAEHAQIAEKTNMESFTKDFEKLICASSTGVMQNLWALFQEICKVETTRAGQRWPLLFPSSAWEAFTFFFTEPQNPQIGLFILAVFAGLSLFIEDKIDSVLRTPEAYRPILITSAAVSCLVKERHADGTAFKIMEFMFQRGLHADSIFKAQTPLSIALNILSFGQIEHHRITYDLVELLLKHGADPNGKVRLSSGEESPALVIAVRAKRPSVVRLLLEHGADPFKEDSDGKNAFYYVEGSQMSHLLQYHLQEE